MVREQQGRGACGGTGEVEGGDAAMEENASFRDFPRGPVVKNLPYNAGDAGSIPGRGTKIPHATGQLSPRTTTTEPARHNY